MQQEDTDPKETETINRKNSRKTAYQKQKEIKGR